MKILRARIGSYGGMKDKDIVFSPGLNTVYGPNEAGKSTLRSFMASTLFSRAKVTYPAQKTTDRGTLEIELEDGSRRTFAKEGKKTDGEGEALCGIEPGEYTAIYSMSPDDLRNTDAIEKGDIRGRFLTVPGGNDLPKVFDDLEKERTAYLPDSRWSSRSVIAARMDDHRKAAEKVKELQNAADGDNHYSDLVARRAELEEQLGRADAELRNANAARDEGLRRESYAAAAAKIKELEEKIERLEYSRTADGGARDTYVALRTRCSSASEDLETKKAASDRASEMLGGIDASKILSCEHQITELSQRSKRRPETDAPRGRTPAAKNGPGIAVIAGLVIAAAGIVIAAAGVSLVVGAAVAAAGVGLAAYAFIAKPAAGGTVHRPEDTKENKETEDLWRRTCAAAGLSPSSPAEDSAKLVSLLEKARGYRSAESELERSRRASDEAEKNLDLFLRGFGGKETFEKALADHEEYERSLAAVSSLREGLPEDVTEPVTTPEGTEGFSADRDRILQSLAATEQAIRDISENGAVEEAITADRDTESSVYRAVLEWAKLALETGILEDACAAAYGAHRPSVLGDADRFLSSMTGGRYGMNLDPKEDGISVVDRSDGTVKNEKLWSSGLGDQVKLSLKMAVALSLSKERPPVVLDDVLLTSDSERKAGAVRALAGMSDRIQVIYFTCDAETRDLMESQGSCIITLRPPADMPVSRSAAGSPAAPF